MSDECRCYGCTLQATTDAPPLVPALPPSRRIVAFTGLAGSGKSTAALHLNKIHGWHRLRFAGPLKAMMAALGLTPDEIEGHLKEQPCALLGGRTPRYAMQTIGTEWGRDLIDRDLWIRAFHVALNRVPPRHSVVIDDCRFPNEADAVRAAGGTLIEIIRPGAGAGAAGHVSEGQNLGATDVIRNDGGVARFLLDVSYILAPAPVD